MLVNGQLPTKGEWQGPCTSQCRSINSSCVWFYLLAKQLLPSSILVQSPTNCVQQSNSKYSCPRIQVTEKKIPPTLPTHCTTASITTHSTRCSPDLCTVIHTISSQCPHTQLLMLATYIAGISHIALFIYSHPLRLLHGSQQSLPAAVICQPLCCTAIMWSTAVTLQQSYCRSHIAAVILQESHCSSHIAGVILQESHCSSHIAGVILQESHCSSHIAGVTLQQSYCRSHIAGVTLQQSYCRSHIAGVTLQQSYCRSHIAAVTLHESYCRSHIAGVTLQSHIAGVILQESHCMSHIAGVTLHESYCRSHIAGVILHESYCRSHIAAVILQESHCRSHIA